MMVPGNRNMLRLYIIEYIVVFWLNDILVWKISGTHYTEDENYGLLDCDPHIACSRSYF